MGQANVERLIEYISDRDAIQKKYLKDVMASLDAGERAELEGILEFFLSDYTLEELGEAYFVFLDNVWEETRYFFTEGHYRYSRVAEVEEKVYFNEKYMKQYMVGLQLTGYLWKTHREVHRWYKEKIKTFKGVNYLEIGPGHGQYFLEAIRCQNFTHYTGIDLSTASVNLASRYISRFLDDKTTDYQLICGDFLTYPFDCTFDGVCIAEVLEHTENPEEILRRIYDLTAPGADVYASVPINSPAVDHIYLFRSIEEVLQMSERAGFTVMDHTYTAEIDGISYEEALKKKCTIILSVHLRHA